MRDLDKMIDEALGEEESEVLRQIGEEPGFFAQAFGLFGGRLGWVNLLMMAVQALLFLAALYAGWMFFDASDPVRQLRWGLPAAVLLILATMIKLALWPEIHVNRLMRELKRIELQIARGGRRP
ncbi:MAG TPA: DUF6768 family protein [Sphingomicrobium sp.]|nr:DUF6768 family protein [Sphingomicrobium sp.]